MTSGERLAKRVCELPGCDNSFTPPRQNPNQRFCSKGCFAESVRKAIPCTCAACGKSFTRRPSEIIPGAETYCDLRCKAIGQRRGPLVLTCPVCGTQRTFTGARRTRALAQTYCSRVCQGKAQRKRVKCVCQLPGCGSTFERPRSDVSNGRGRYCCTAHGRAARRRPVKRRCERCGNGFTVSPSGAGRRYCSWACYLGTVVGYQDVACDVCGTPRRIHRSVLAKGHGRYCSRACYFRDRGQGRVDLTCQRPGCDKSFSVPTSASQQRYCSRECADEDRGRAIRRFKCRRCQSYFTVPAWRRRPHFCSLKCANSGRRRAPHPDDVARNRRIFDLHGSGLNSRQIAEAIEGLTADAIRQILARARRPGARAWQLL